MFRITTHHTDGSYEVTTVASREEVFPHVPGFRGPMWWLDEISEPFEYTSHGVTFIVERI